MPKRRRDFQEITRLQRHFVAGGENHTSAVHVANILHIIQHGGSQHTILVISIITSLSATP